uniref:Methyltransferase domain-containing protein n=1 Tax=Panagrolaimus sp. ES5 TaxID=591445 RepID=A0AC34GN54_9BILA
MAQCQITLIFYVATLFIFGYILFYKCLPLQELPEIDDKIIFKYQQQALIRQRILPEKIDIDGYGILYNVLVPEVFCKNLIRIGYVGDGGKWVCNPTNLLSFESCTIYSFGMNNDPSFEEDFQNFLNNKCKLRCIDKDDQNDATTERLKNVNGAFKKALIGARKDDSLNMFQISDIVAEFGDTKIDILKIDIEGAEFDNVEHLFPLPICQILIEIHGQTPKETLNLLRTLSEHEYYLFSYEINGFHHHLSEYSFIHKTCFAEYSVKTVYGKYLSNDK